MRRGHRQTVSGTGRADRRAVRLLLVLAVNLVMLLLLQLVQVLLIMVVVLRQKVVVMVDFRSKVVRVEWWLLLRLWRRGRRQLGGHCGWLCAGAAPI